MACVVELSAEHLWCAASVSFPYFAAALVAQSEEGGICARILNNKILLRDRYNEIEILQTPSNAFLRCRHALML